MCVSGGGAGGMEAWVATAGAEGRMGVGSMKAGTHVVWVHYPSSRYTCGVGALPFTTTNPAGFPCVSAMHPNKPIRRDGPTHPERFPERSHGRYSMAARVKGTHRGKRTSAGRVYRT